MIWKTQPCFDKGNHTWEHRGILVQHDATSRNTFAILRNPEGVVGVADAEREGPIGVVEGVGVSEGVLDGVRVDVAVMDGVGLAEGYIQ